MRKFPENRTWSWIFINHDWWGEAKLDEVTSRVGVVSVGRIITFIPDSSFLQVQVYHAFAFVWKGI